MASADAIGIVGAGAFGTAMAGLLAGRGGRVVTVSPDGDLLGMANACELVLIAVPSPRAPAAVRMLGDVLTGRHGVVHAIGAFHVVDGKPERFSELVKRETAVKRVGVLAGPALAADLSDRRPVGIVMASPFDALIALGRERLGSPTLRLYGSRDLIGVELASALSGAMAVAVGLADGAGVGIGPRAILITRAVAEGSRLITAAGGAQQTFAGLAGLGNILVRTSSASSERSVDYQHGLRLGRGLALDHAETEGVRAASVGCDLAKKLGIAVPILEAVREAARDRRPIPEVAARLLEHVARDE